MQITMNTVVTMTYEIKDAMEIFLNQAKSR